MITRTVEIACSPEDVFAYVTDLSSHPEWQGEIVSVEVETEGPADVGTRWTDMRRMPGGPRAFTYEITALDPPRVVRFTGGRDPISIDGAVEVEPAQEGSGSLVTMRLEFAARGFAKPLAPFFRWRARRALEEQQAALKTRLESGAS